MTKKKGGKKKWKKLDLETIEDTPPVPTEVRTVQGTDNSSPDKPANSEETEDNQKRQEPKETEEIQGFEESGACGGSRPAHQSQPTYSNVTENENNQKGQEPKETEEIQGFEESGACGGSWPAHQSQPTYSNVTENKSGKIMWKQIPLDDIEETPPASTEVRTVQGTDNSASDEPANSEETEGIPKDEEIRDFEESGACGGSRPTNQPILSYSNITKNKSQIAKIEIHEKVENEEPFDRNDMKSASVETASLDSDMNVSSSRPAPSPGTVGRKINLVANVFDLKFNRDIVYHYDVDVSECKTSRNGAKPKKPKVSKEQCKEVFNAFVKKLRKQKAMEKFGFAYDGNKNLFTASKLPEDFFSVPLSIEINGKLQTFQVTVKPVKKADGSNIINIKSLKNRKNYSLNEMNEVIYLLNAILNYRDENCQLIKVGRSFFSFSEKLSVGEGLELFKGINQSVQCTEKGPAVVVNLTAKLFHKPGPAIEYVNEILHRDVRQSRRPLTYSEVKKIESALKGVRIFATHSKYKRKYYIERVSQESAEILSMDLDGNRTTIAQYFEKNYGRLKCPYLPCFQMRGSARSKVYIPFENCSVLEAQPKKLDEKLSTRVASVMIKETAVLPEERFRKIEEYTRSVNTEHMKNFDLNVYSVPKSVEGRVLDPPVLLLAGNKTAIPQSNGSWWMEGKFLRPIKNKSWILLRVGDANRSRTNRVNLEKFAKALDDASRSLGLILGEFKGIKVIGKDIPLIRALGENEVRSSSLVIIVLVDSNSNTYNEIKFIADYNLKLITQCVLEDAVLKLSPKTISNICLKINVKLGGVNHGLLLKGAPEILKKNCIILGADVVHSTKSPSIAAVVGTVDQEISKYQVSCRVQENENKNKKSQELILELEKMVGTVFAAFMSHNNADTSKKAKILPKAIVYFRDGVSEGQFDAVQKWEIAQIKAASRRVFGKEIPVTFIIVQKRHQVRLRPQNPKEGIGAGKNVPANTKVDTVITYPNLLDFFICSHEGIRGTSKPTRYTVLQDDNKLQPNTIHALALSMCYLCFACTKSISIPAPINYADHAAYRAKNYVDFYMSKEKQYRYSALPESIREAINKMEDSKNHMFYV